jgi:integrase
MRFRDTGDVVIISESDARKIIEHVKPKWKLPVKICYYYGLRSSEVMRLTPENFRDGVFVCRRLKGGAVTRQAIHSDIREELLELLKHRTPGTKLFPYSRQSLYDAIHHGARKAGVDECYAHAHAFRHAAGRRWARVGTINEIQSMFGHRTLKMALLYSQLACSEEISRKFLA